MLILVHVKLEYEKGKSCLLNICGHDFLFFNNQIDSVSLLEFVEKSNLKGSYFLRTRSLYWSMFKAFTISFLSLVKVSEYFLKAQFSMKHDIETRKKRIRKFALRTRFLINNQIVLVASTRTCREVQLERVILFECPVTLLVDVQSVYHFFFVIGKSI